MKINNMKCKYIFIKLFFYILLLFSLMPNAIFSNAEINVLLSSNSSTNITTLNSLQSKIDFPIKLSFLSSMNEEEQTNYFKLIEASKTPFIITIGNQASLKAKENLSDVKILFSYVNAPSTHNFSSEKNVCGVHTDISIKEYFKIINEILKVDKKIVSFYSTKAGEFYASEGEYYELLFDLDYRKIFIQNKNSLQENLEALKGNVNAIYIVNDPIYSSENFQILSNFAKENKIILFSQIPFIVQIGATFSLTPYFARVGVHLAELANRINAGSFECQNSKGILIKEFFISVNNDFAIQSKVQLPDSLIKRSQNSKFIVEGINSFEEGNFELSETIFDKVLKIDPTDSVALNYKSEINLQRKGINVQGFLIQAEEAQKKGNLSKARELYKRIISVQPNNQIAIDKVEQIQILESENERAAAEQLDRNGDFYGAISRYNSAISILSSNGKAKSALENLRQRERKNIPNYLVLATKFYNQRKYTEAELGFNKILAIDPSDKSALEYLKLSGEKKISMKKFENCIASNDRKCKLIWNNKK